MDISLKRIKSILGFSLFFSFVQAQHWEAKVTYDKTDSTEILKVNIMPDYGSLGTFEIDFSKSILEQNYKEQLELWKIQEGIFEKVNVQAPFFVINKEGFSYEIDLLKSVHIPSKAYLNYGPIQIANWQEILFDCKDEVKMNLVFVKDSNRYELGIKTLEEWKANPTRILPAKTIVQVNKVNVVSNLSSKEMQQEVEKVLKAFTYLKENKEVVLLFAHDSLPSGGISYPKLAIVYIDAKTSDSNPKFALQHTLLHELFHYVSPYEIRPEKEALLIDKNWLAEATPEYLSLHYQFINGLITEATFIDKLEQKSRTATKFDGKSLNNMALDVYKDASYYEAFYSKGCIALFLLDLKLYQESKGGISIAGLIMGVFPEMNEEQQLYINNMMYEQEQALVYNNNPFAMNQYLAPFGWLYQKQLVLPFTSASETAEIRIENIIPNKMATVEQKALWEGFKKK